MTLPDPLEKKEPKTSISRKNAVMAIVILLAIVIISVIVVVVLVQSPAGSGATLSPSGGATTSPAVVEKSFGPTGSQLVPQANMQPVDDSPEVKTVDFFIDAGSQEKCGLTCRQLTPSITNTGNKTAHNVCISIVLSNSGGDLILLNGEPSFRRCIGNIASGESKSEPIIINADCGFLASKCIRQTLILKTKATSDETTVQFPDQIIAV
ncbi:MAG: hypothetical protein Q7U51_14385 [Methanoregula sp.]|nr:hypothetical protein [Methanoregula sp.]